MPNNDPKVFRTEAEGVSYYCLKRTSGTYNDGKNYHQVYLSSENRAFYFNPTKEGVEIIEIKALC